jgi:plasmid rolling circle replication initiator protein Rep
MLQLQDLKEALKDIVDSEKEIHQYKPTMLKFYAKLEFDKRYKAEKKRKSLEEKVEKLNELDILMGRSE